MHYLLIYDFVPDYVERRGQFRDEHLKLAWEANQRGELRLTFVHGAPADIVVDDGASVLTLRVMDREHAATVWFIDGGDRGMVAVEGAYLPRGV